MLRPANAENDVVAGETDFHHYIAVGHLLQELEWATFVHHVNAMSDAFGMTLLYRIAHMKLQVLGRDKALVTAVPNPERALDEFARVQRDVHMRITLVKVIEHAHVQRKISHGDIPVFRHHQVQAQHVRVRSNQFGVGPRQQKAGENLGEDHLFGLAPRDLEQETLLDLATRIGFGYATVKDIVA